MTAFGWTHGPDQEGPFNETFATREAAIADGTACYCGDPFWVAGAVAVPGPRPDIAEEMLERADQEVNDNVCFDDPIFDATPEQEADLDRRLADAFVAWCEEHRFTANGYLVGKWGTEGYERITPAAAPVADQPEAGGAR